MRFWGPIVVLVAIVLFIVTLLLACALSIVWPLFALGCSLVALSLLRPFVAFMFLRHVPDGFVHAWRALHTTTLALVHPLRPQRVALPPMRKLPQLEAMVAQVAQHVGAPSFSDIMLVPEANFGVMELQTTRGLRRVLIVGAPLVFVLTVEELRAVIAHELAHVTLRHTRWSRALGRWIDMVEAFGADAEGRLNPIAWSFRFSAWMLSKIHGPWSRSEEYAADRFAAKHFGKDVLSAALRKACEVGASLEVLMAKIQARVDEASIAPESWTEASFRMYEKLPAQEKVNLRRALREDPFDIDGRSHPPMALRIGAIADLRKMRAEEDRRAIAVLPDVLMEERRLSRAHLPAATVVPARTWFSQVDRGRMEKRSLDRVQAATGYQEIDFG